MNHSSFPNFTIVLIQEERGIQCSYVQWEFDPKMEVPYFRPYFRSIPWYIPLHSLETSAKNGRYLGTSNKSVLEIARRMHIAALWLMLTWRACWPSLRRIWRDPTGPKCRQNCWIPPLKNMQINGHLWASTGRERQMDNDGYIYIMYTHYIYTYIG